MRVYRVEHEQGQGPYNGHFDYEDSEADELTFVISSAHTHESGHPSERYYLIWEPDGNGTLLGNSKDYVSGFISFEQFRVWFRGFRNKLTNTGFKLSVYEVPDKFVQFSDKQAVFNRKEATKLGWVYPNTRGEGKRLNVQ